MISCSKEISIEVSVKRVRQKYIAKWSVGYFFKVLKPNCGLSICRLSCTSTELTYNCHRVGNYSFARQGLLPHISDAKPKQSVCPYEAVVSS